MAYSNHIASNVTWNGVSGNMGRRGLRKLPDEAKRPSDRYKQTGLLAVVAIVAFIFTPIPMTAPTRNLQVVNVEPNNVVRPVTRQAKSSETTGVKYHSKKIRKQSAKKGVTFHSKRKQRRAVQAKTAVASQQQPAQVPKTRLFEDNKSQSQSPPIVTNTKEAKRRIPQVLLAGTQKAGTSSLAVYLSNLPNTCFSDKSNDSGIGGSLGKEPHFFDARHAEGLSTYQDLYQHCSDSDLLIDGTPETMLFPDQVRATYDEHGSAKDVKIIFILREPVARELSWYNHRLRYAKLPPKDRPAWSNDVWSKNGRHIKTFLEAQQFLFYNFRFRRYNDIYGYYAHWLKKWSSLFDRSQQILVLSYDELNGDPVALLQRVHAFLDLPVPEATVSTMRLTRENAADGSEAHVPPPPCTDLRRVERLFERPNAELVTFLNQNPGPSMEQRPFPPFHTPVCRTPVQRKRPRRTSK